MFQEPKDLDEKVRPLLKKKKVDCGTASIGFVPSPAEGEQPLLIVNVPSAPRSKVGALRRAIRRKLGNDFRVQINNEPEDEQRDIADILRDHYPNGDISPETLREQLSPQSLRSWASRNAPEGVEVSSLDFHEISGKVSVEGKKKRKQLTLSVAVLHACVPSHRSEEFVQFAKLFEEKWEIPLLLNPISLEQTALDILRENLALSTPGVISKKDIPRLQELLASRLRWRTPKQSGNSVNMCDGYWFSIDDDKTVMREDLFWIEYQPNDRYVIHVAQSDITSKRDGDEEDHYREKRGKKDEKQDFILKAEPMRPERLRVKFEVEKPSPAWVVDLAFQGDKMISSSEPYRALVMNKRQFSTGDAALKTIEGYSRIKHFLHVRSDFSLTATLMARAQKAVGEFLHKNGMPFLKRRALHTSEVHSSIFTNLREAGIDVRHEDFNSSLRIAALAQIARDKGAYASLPPLISALVGKPVVVTKQNGGCSIKGLRGSPEQINQWILAAAVDDKPDALPSFIRDIIDAHAVSTDAISRDLQTYENERHLAKFTKMLIATLSQQGRELRVCVLHRKNGVMLCESPVLKRWGFVKVKKGRYQEGSYLTVKLGQFDLNQKRFEFLHPRKIVESPGSSRNVA